MTEKELRKLRRQDLLELLLQQGREAAQIGAQLAETETDLSEMQSGHDRLKNRLDSKDATISKLKTRLDEKDALIEKLKARLDKKDATIAELKANVQSLASRREVEISEIISALKLNTFFDVVRQASDQYLHQLPEIKAVPLIATQETSKDDALWKPTEEEPAEEEPAAEEPSEEEPAAEEPAEEEPAAEEPSEEEPAAEEPSEEEPAAEEPAEEEPAAEEPSEEEPAAEEPAEEEPAEEEPAEEEPAAEEPLSLQEVTPEYSIPSRKECREVRDEERRREKKKKRHGSFWLRPHGSRHK